MGHTQLLSKLNTILRQFKKGSRTLKDEPITGVIIKRKNTDVIRSTISSLLYL